MDRKEAGVFRSEGGMFWLERGGMLLRNGEYFDEMGRGRVVSFFGMERGLSERLVRGRSVEKESGKTKEESGKTKEEREIVVLFSNG